MGVSPVPARSQALSAALRFVVVLRIEVDVAEYIENAEPFSGQPIFGKGGVDGLLFCFVVAGAGGLLNQVVVESEIRRMCRVLHN
jgi:hypothetical protein